MFFFIINIIYDYIKMITSNVCFVLYDVCFDLCEKFVNKFVTFCFAKLVVILASMFLCASHRSVLFIFVLIKRINWIFYFYICVFFLWFLKSIIIFPLLIKSCLWKCCRKYGIWYDKIYWELRAKLYCKISWESVHFRNTVCKWY